MGNIQIEPKRKHTLDAAVYQSPAEEASKADERVNKKLHYYLNEGLLTELALALDAPPEEQQDILRNYVQKILRDIKPHIKSPNNVGALLNLKFSNNKEELDRQIRDLFRGVQGLDEALLKTVTQDEEVYKTYVTLARRLRKDIIRLLTDETESKKMHQLGRVYGEGGMGVVYGLEPDEHLVIKMRKWKEENQGGQEKQEVEGGIFDSEEDTKQLISASSDPNLVRYYGFFEVENVEGESGRDADLYEKLEDMKSLNESVTLSALTSSNPEIKKQSILYFLKDTFIPACQGVKALHKRDLVHRDLKPENIVTATVQGKRVVKVGDYDLMCRSGFKAEKATIMGTPNYISPEQALSDTVGPPSDIYALGKILYILFGGKKLETMPALAQAISKTPYDLKELKLPPEVEQLIEHCLQPEPRNRPTIEGLIQDIHTILAHYEEFLSKQPQQKLEEAKMKYGDFIKSQQGKRRAEATVELPRNSVMGSPANQTRIMGRQEEAQKKVTRPSVYVDSGLATAEVRGPIPVLNTQEIKSKLDNEGSVRASGEDKTVKIRLSEATIVEQPIAQKSIPLDPTLVNNVGLTQEIIAPDLRPQKQFEEAALKSQQKITPAVPAKEEPPFLEKKGLWNRVKSIFAPKAPIPTVPIAGTQAELADYRGVKYENVFHPKKFTLEEWDSLNRHIDWEMVIVQAKSLAKMTHGDPKAIAAESVIKYWQKVSGASDKKMKVARGYIEKKIVEINKA